MAVLDDRSYMRDPMADANRWRSGTMVIIIANVAMFLLFEIHRVAFTRFGLDDYLRQHFMALSWGGIKKGFFWQLATFQFMHGGIFHLLFNCLTIYMFGKPMEESLGRAGFYKLYFIAGTGGGVMQVVLAGLFPSFVPDASVVGASAGAFGLVAAFATLNPDRVLTFLLFLFIPVSMKAWALLLISGALALYGLIFSRDNIAHAAHLGGMMAGMGFIWAMAKGWSWSRIWPKPRVSTRARELVATPAARKPSWNKPAADALPSSEEFISREVDPILDKISAQGIHSLTDHERRILEAARHRMSKR